MFLGVLRWPTPNLKSETFVHKNRPKFFPQESFLRESFSLYKTCWNTRYNEWIYFLRDFYLRPLFDWHEMMNFIMKLMFRSFVITLCSSCINLHQNMKRCYTEALRIFFSESGEKRQVMTLNDLSKKRKKIYRQFSFESCSAIKMPNRSKFIWVQIAKKKCKNILWKY